jgi:hypothetical protein
MNRNDKNYGYSLNVPQQWNYPGQAGAGPGPSDCTITNNSNWGTYSDAYQGNGASVWYSWERSSLSNDKSRLGLGEVAPAQ